MSHPKRVHVPGGIYLVSALGHKAEPLFADRGDREMLGKFVGEVVARCAVQVHAFKWLEDELLMILQVSAISLPGVMHRITSMYARRVHQKRRHRGPLFQHPYRSVLLEDTGSLMEAVLTVHDFPPSLWSSRFAYLGAAEVPWLTRRMILNLLGSKPDSQAVAYRAMLKRVPQWRALEDLEFCSSSRLATHRPYDQFAQWLKCRARERAKPATLEQLTEAIARWLQVDPAAITSIGSSPLLSLVRALVVWHAMQNNIASLRDLAIRFHRSRSTLHEARERYRLRAPELFSIGLSEIMAGPTLPIASVLRRMVEARTAEIHPFHPDAQSRVFLPPSELGKVTSHHDPQLGRRK